MNPIRFLLAGVCALFLFAETSSPNASPSIDAREQALRALEEKWLASEQDPEALESILADDFVHVLESGFVSKRQQIEFFKTHHPPEAARHFELLRIRIYGDTGVANGVVVAVASGGSVSRTIFTDVFVCRTGRWQAVNAQELPLPAKPQQSP